MQNRWAIQRCAKSCMQSGKDFQKGDLVLSRIIENGSNSTTRIDYLSDKAPELSTDQTLLSQWQYCYQAKATKKQSLWSENSPEKVLQDLIDADEPATEPERYILALLLERQKKIKELDVRVSHRGQLHVYIHKQTEAIFLIKSAAIPSNKLAELELRIGELLKPLK